MAGRRWQPGGDVYAEVTRLVAEVFGVPIGSLTPDTHFVYDLDESLQVAETVGQLARYIEHRLGPGEEVWPPTPKRPSA
jgi:acyl carrier protein